MQVVVSKNEEKSRYFHLSGSLKKIGKYVGRGKKRSIAVAVVENASLRGEVVSSLCNEARKEIHRGYARTLTIRFYACQPSQHWSNSHGTECGMNCS